MSKKRKRLANQLDQRRVVKKSPAFWVALILGLTIISLGTFLIYTTLNTPKPTFYSSTKPLHAFNQKGEVVAWANVTLKTNISAPQSHFPINVTIRMRGINVPKGNWTYAVIEGAIASYPNKEPDDWEHELQGVIVLKNSISSPFTYVGSRIMNYTSEGDWNIIIHVVKDTIFIVNNIPPNPTNLPMEIYAVPNAVHIAQAESVAQIKDLETSTRSGTFWMAIGLILASISGPLLFAYSKYVEWRELPK